MRVVAQPFKIKIHSQVEDPLLLESRREQLVRAAAKRFSINGYHRTTIKEIAATAGFSPGLVYAYVKDKEDVLFLVIVDILETYSREIPQALEGIQDPLQRFCVAVRAYCKTVGRNLDATVLAYRETQSLRPERRNIIKQMELDTNHLLSDSIQQCIDAGLFRSVNVDLVTYRIVLLAHGWALKAWHFRKITTLEKYIREGLDLFLHALLNKRGWRQWKTQQALEASQALRSKRTAKA